MQEKIPKKKKLFPLGFKLSSKIPIFILVIATLIQRVFNQDDGPFPLRIQNDISRLWPIKHGYENGDQLYDRLVLTIIPAVVKHLEDTFEAFDTK